MLRIPPKVTTRNPLWTLAVLLSLSCPAYPQDLDTKLVDAARTHETTELQNLLTKGANPNAKDKNGRTPLMEASSGGYADTVRVLLEYGADVNAKDMVGWSALFWAAFSGRKETLRILVAKGADVKAKDNEGRTALFWAASSGYTDAVRALLAKGASVNAKDTHGWTPIMSAADLGHLDTVRALLEGGADPNVHGKDGNTAQSLAKKYKYDDIVSLLQSSTQAAHGKGPSDTGPGKSGGHPSTTEAAPLRAGPTTTPALSKSELLNQKLLQAAEGGDTAEVLSLIRDGAGVNAIGDTYGNTALMEAAARGYTNTVRTLLEKGAEVNAKDKAGRTALMQAAFGGYTDTVQLLLEKGAEVNAADREGWTPLFWATFSRRTGTVRLLLEKGANVNAKNKYEDCALIHAAYAGDVDTVAVLLEYHADLNARDNQGKTALIEAARQGHTDAVHLLLENGAAADLQARDGNTAISLAIQQHHADIVALLKNPPKKREEKAAPEVTAPSPEANPSNAADSKTNPLVAETQALQKGVTARAYYGMGLSMSFLEDLWPRMDHDAARAAAAVLGDLRKVGGPEELIELAQQISTRLAFPSEEHKGPLQPLIVDLRNRLDRYCLSQSDGKFFYAAGGFTYELNLLGQNLKKPDHGETSIEETRRRLLPLASNFSAKCADIPECKGRGLAYLSDAATILQRTPLLSADGTTLEKLSDDIGVALGTEEQ
jgi:ankyrin repeat protein